MILCQSKTKNKNYENSVRRVSSTYILKSKQYTMYIYFIVYHPQLLKMCIIYYQGTKERPMNIFLLYLWAHNVSPLFIRR